MFLNKKKKIVIKAEQNLPAQLDGELMEVTRFDIRVVPDKFLFFCWKDRCCIKACVYPIQFFASIWILTQRSQSFKTPINTLCVFSIVCVNLSWRKRAKHWLKICWAKFYNFVIMANAIKKGAEKYMPSKSWKASLEMW